MFELSLQNINRCMNTKASKISFNNTEIAYAHFSNRSLKKAAGVYQLLGNSFLVNLGTSLTKIALAIHFPIRPFVKPLIFKQFCGGETLKECLPSINLLEQKRVDVNLNYGVEIKKSEKDFDKSFCKNKGALEFAGRKKNVKVVSCKLSGLGNFDLLEKMQKAQSLTSKEEAAFERMKKRMDDLCAIAKEQDVAIYWDAEESWVQTEIDRLVDEFMQKYNTEKAIVFNTFQLYRVDKLQYLKDSIAHAQSNNYFLGAKLVRGAYIEKENEWAEENDEVSVLHTKKKDVDKDYNAALALCLDNIEKVSFCVASHNEESNLWAANEMLNRGIAANHPHVSFSQLYGMGDFISFNLSEAGFNVVKYMPFGPIEEVIPYLIRRAQENSSVNGQTSRELSMLKKEIQRRKL